jgi:putative membrane protein
MSRYDPPAPRSCALARIAIGVTACGALPAWAHGLPAPGAPAVEGPEWWVIACLAVSLVMYGGGLVRLMARARLGRGALRREAACFGAGWIALALALVSPLDAAGGVSFSAHMVQHELLMIVAAPLMVLGRPLGVWAWSVPQSWLRPLGGALRSDPLRGGWRMLTRPLHAWLLHFVALWLWHVPALFQAALHHPAIHALQHASFLFPALLFWWAVLDGVHTGRDRGAAIAYLFTTMLHTGALGALFAVSGKVWYPAYGAGAAQFGLSALEDQQLGGLIMWVPGGLAYVIAGLALCAAWLRQPARGALS